MDDRSSPSAPWPECSLCDRRATTTINNGKTDVCRECKESEEMARDFGKELAKGRLILNAWLNAGPNPAFHQAMKDKLRKEWPTLYAAIDSFCRP